MRHAAILRGLFAGLFLCELAGQAGLVPSLLAGGLGTLLRLPFLAPSLLGAFVSQVLLRPQREEVLTALAAALALGWPLFSLAAGDQHAVAITVMSAVGLGTLLALAFRALTQRGEERNAVLDVLLPAALLPAFVILAHPMVFLTAALWPTTWDHRLYLADAAFGAPLSFVVGRAIAAVPLLPSVCLAVYVALPLALMLVHTLRRRNGIRSGDTLATFIALTVVGYFGYLLVPVAGPLYAFGEQFPLNPPDPATMLPAKSLMLPMPRNCMPSLHSGWALLVWWNARPLGLAARTAAAVFLAITLLATVGLGFHYVVDLVAAFPLTMAVQAWGTHVVDARRRRSAMAAGALMTMGWIALVTWCDAMLRWPPVLLWALAAAVVSASWLLERRVHDVRSSEAPQPAIAPRPLSWLDRGAVGVLLLAGFASFLDWSITSNTLAVTLGSTAEVRATLGTVSLLSIALGVVLSGATRASSSYPLPLATVAAVVLAIVGWTSAVGLDAPLVENGAGFSLDGIALAARMLAAPSMVSGLLVGFVARRMTASQPRPGRAVGLTLASTFFGASLAALAGAYAVIPSAYSQHLPVACHLAAALLSFGLAMGASLGTRTEEEPADVRPDANTPPLGGAGFVAFVLGGWVGGTLLVTHAGLLGVILGDTVYSRAQVVFTVFLGLAAGGFVAQRALQQANHPRLAQGWAFAGLAASVALTLPLWSQAPGYFASFYGYVEAHGLMTLFSQRESLRLVVGGFFTLLPVSCLAAAFVLGVDGLRGDTGGVRTWTLAFAAAALGVVAGVATTELAALPRFGSRWTLDAVVVVAVGFAASRFARATGEARTAGGVVLTAVALLLLAAPRPFDFERIASDSGLTLAPGGHGRLVAAMESAEGLVTVHRLGDVVGPHRLVVAGRLREQVEVGREPAAREVAGLLHGEGRTRALVVGLGSGKSLRLLRGAGFEEIVVAEPNDAVVSAAREHLDNMQAGALDAPATRLRAADGRHALVSEGGRFDLVGVSMPDTSAAAAAPLYTREFYGIAAARLNPGGVLEQRISLDVLSAIGLTSILGAARRSFEDVRFYFVGNDAVLVACSGRCSVDARSEGRRREQEVLAGIAERSGSDATFVEHSGWLDTAATDRLLASIAGHLGAPVEALGSADNDMFLPYYAPMGFLATRDAPPESVLLLRNFADLAVR